MGLMEEGVVIEGHILKNLKVFLVKFVRGRETKADVSALPRVFSLKVGLC